MGLLEPSFGRVELDGHNALADLPEYKKRLGYVPEEPHLYTYLTGPEYLQLIGRLRNCARRQYRVRRRLWLCHRRNGSSDSPAHGGIPIVVGYGVAVHHPLIRKSMLCVRSRDQASRRARRNRCQVPLG
jgi:hypothetical protein